MRERFQLKVEYSFEVGNQEHHQVDFYFGKVVGHSLIKVDGQIILDETRPFPTYSGYVKKYELSVGNNEKHTVNIEKIEKVVFGGFRKQRLRVLVDGEVIADV